MGILPAIRNRTIPDNYFIVPSLQNTKQPNHLNQVGPFIVIQNLVEWAGLMNPNFFQKQRRFNT